MVSTVNEACGLFSAMRALIEQLGLPIDKVGSSQDVEFLGKA